MNSARAYVEAVVKMHESMGVGPEGARYRSYEALVLANGREWEHAPLPRGVRMDKVRECFRNAFRLAESRSDLTYVEGWATHHIPCHHAWTVGAAGRVVDPTWRPRSGDPTPRDYFGVPFDLDYVRRVTLETERWGVFYNSKETLHRDPAEYLKKL